MSQSPRKVLNGRAVLAALVFGAVCLRPAAALPARADPAGAERTAWELKLDPFLRMAALGVRRSSGVFSDSIPGGSAEGLRLLPPFVRAERGAPAPVLYLKAQIKDDGQAVEALRELGAEVRGRVGPIASLRAPLSALEGIASLPQIEWLKAAHSYRTQNNVSTSSTFVASRDANATFGTKGAGVIVAVVDTGIDWTNHDFRKADGTSRLLAIWDQTITDPLHPPPAGFSFGAYYPKSVIDAALASAGSLPTKDGFGHGSHVAGSAAGNGLQTGNGVPAGTFAGIAPEADLLMVRVFDDQGNFCIACDLTAAVQFIQGFAAVAGEPWVGNMSLGDDLGAHDGTDPDERTIDAAVGPGRPGSQVSIAAGNSGNKSIHWDGTLSTGATASTTFSLPSYTPNAGSDNDFIWLDLWYKGSDKDSVTLVGPGGQTVSAAYGTTSGLVCTTAGGILIDATNAPDPGNGDNEVFVQIWDSGSCSPVVIPQVGSWTIRIHGDSVTSGAGAFDLWDEAAIGALGSVSLTGATFTKLVSVPGTSRNALTAAAYVGKSQWVNVRGTTSVASVSNSIGGVSSFSGIGPTRDGRQKPDVAAPGEFIGSTLVGSLVTLVGALGTEQDGQHGDIRGTSMATPHVAGVAALLFALNRSLDGPLIKAAIARGAQVDSFTGTVPNVRYGSGKLRALEGGYQAASIVTDLAAAGATSFTGTDSRFVDSYNVYRGTIPGISATSYGTCFLKGLASPAFGDPSLPAAGQAFFYLVTGVHAGAEGILGTDGSGNVRPNNTPCL